MPADTIGVANDPHRPVGSLTWYRRNNHSAFVRTMSDQMLGKLAANMTDPLLGRTSGAEVVGVSGGEAMMTTNASHMQSHTAATQHIVTIITHTSLDCASETEFVAKLDALSRMVLSPSMARPGHDIWWGSFWNRSWIVLDSVNNQTNGSALTAAYDLNRYLTAIQSRGALPIHHNGGTLTWGWDGNSHCDPDQRGWGGGYWFQNVRHSYWYAIAAGDYDLFGPLFRMYTEQLPVLVERGRQWWGVDGAQFGETTYFFGTYEPVDYGCGRSGVPDLVNPYIRHHYEGGVELAVMMLQVFHHTHNTSQLTSIILPWCENILRFYDQHYPKYSNGTFYLKDAQSCETWPTCTNPAPQVSALHRIAEGLMAIDAALLSPEQQKFFARVANSLPQVPLTTNSAGELQISPCQGGFPAHHVNSENVETYAIWPYEIFAINRSSGTSSGDLGGELPVSIGNSTFQNVHFGHGNSAWRYDGQDAVLLGMASYALRFVNARVFSQGRTEASRFPGYLSSDPGDGAPEVESNGIVAVTLQKMFVQEDGRRVLLFPAALQV